jgi:hypothetical protein
MLGAARDVTIAAVDQNKVWGRRRKLNTLWSLPRTARKKLSFGCTVAGHFDVSTASKAAIMVVR